MDASPIDSLLSQHQTHTVLEHVHEEGMVVLGPASKYVVCLLGPADYLLEIIA
jgi:hypothetical protein